MIRLRDFRGDNCYLGAFLGVLALFALTGEAAALEPSIRALWCLISLTAGLNLGVGVMRNYSARLNDRASRGNPGATDVVRTP
jgi:hypothetical protein